MKVKNIDKKGGTYYANYTNQFGKRFRNSLGKDLAQAKVQLAQQQANSEIAAYTNLTDVTNKR